MKTLLSVAIATLVLAQPASGAPPTKERAAAERSMDIPTRHATRSQQRSALVPLEDATSARVTVEQVGDPDSFGRPVKYLGVASQRSVALQADCTGYDTSFGDRCITLLPAPATTSFDEADLGRLELPAKAANSLLCFTMSPIIVVDFANPGSAPSTAVLNTRAALILENPVLNDPTLIDPATGLPFGGQMRLRLTLSLESRTLAAGAVESRVDLTSTRSCIDGLVNKRSLVELGLSEKQANQFFRSPMTLRFGSRVDVGSVSYLDFSYSMRIYGD